MNGGRAHIVACRRRWGASVVILDLQDLLVTLLKFVKFAAEPRVAGREVHSSVQAVEIASDVIAKQLMT